MDIKPNTSRLVTVFGGSGFIGRHVVRALARRGYRVRVAVRRPDLAGFLQPLGIVGQIHGVQANLRYPASVAAAIAGADAVVNLVGILRQSGRQGFTGVHAMGARTVAEACAAAGIANLVHVSAIGADAHSPSLYGRSKAAGETAIREHVPGAVILRPSVVFGPEDAFFNRFAAMARALPVLPVIGDGAVRFQPVFVGDVAEAVARGVEGRLSHGTVYELGGPETRSFREILAYVCRETGRDRPILPLPLPLARFQARLLEIADMLTLGLIPDAFMLTRDQLAMLSHDNVVSTALAAEGRTLEGMGIAPASIEAVVPSYLWRFRKAGQFSPARGGVSTAE